MWAGAGLAALLGLGCSAPPSSAGTQPVTLELVERSCATPTQIQPPFASLRSVQVLLSSAQGAQQSGCVAGPFADLAALQQALRAAGVTFTDLAPGEGEIKVLGFAKDGCQEPVPLCGSAAFTLAEQTRIEVPVHCWGQPDAVPFNLCVDGVANRVVDGKVEVGLWSPWVWTMSSPVAQRVSERSHSPDHSLLTSLDEAYVVYWSAPMFRVDAGASYTLRYWAWLENVVASGGGTGVAGCIKWCSADHDYCDEFDWICGRELTGSTAGWQAVDLQTSAPAGASGALVWIRVEVDGGSVWLDDVSLVETSR